MAILTEGQGPVRSGGEAKWNPGPLQYCGPKDRTGEGGQGGFSLKARLIQNQTEARADLQVCRAWVCPAESTVCKALTEKFLGLYLLQWLLIERAQA